MPAPDPPQPLRFTPILKQKVWGGRRLARYGKPLPLDAPIGESWEIADLVSTAPGGGGGEPARSVIAGGPLAGRTLHDAIDLWQDRLMGRTPLTEAGDFPLLVKFLDAREDLSVQVHPSPTYAAKHPGSHLKTEAWCIVEAEPGSAIYAGLRPGVSGDDLDRAARAGRGVVELLQRIDAVPGDCHLLPSGTVHALGAGVLVLEVQTPSDTTFRLYDWALERGRSGRELHLHEALACAEIGPAPEPTRIPSGAVGDRLCATEHFDIWSYNLPGGSEIELGWAAGRPIGIACIGGKLQARAGESVELAPGGVTLVPASLSEGAMLSAIGHAKAVCFGVGPA